MCRTLTSQSLLGMASGSRGGPAGDWDLSFLSPLAAEAAEGTAWQARFSARTVSFTVDFAVFRRLMNWPDIDVEENKIQRQMSKHIQIKATRIVGISFVYACVYACVHVYACVWLSVNKYIRVDMSRP